MTEIQTTTAGSLPRTRSLIEANGARTFSDDGFTLESTPEFEELTAQAVADVVARQRTAGITQVGDGEFGKAMSNAVDYGAWWSYSFQRAGGLSLTEVNAFNEPPTRSEPGAVRLTSFGSSSRPSMRRPSRSAPGPRPSRRPRGRSSTAVRRRSPPTSAT